MSKTERLSDEDLTRLANCAAWFPPFERNAVQTLLAEVTAGRGAEKLKACDDRGLREKFSELIYRGMSWAAVRSEGERPPEWVQRGNSFAQDEARRIADQIVALSIAPPARQAQDELREAAREAANYIRGDSIMAFSGPVGDRIAERIDAALRTPPSAATDQELDGDESTKCLICGVALQRGDRVLPDMDGGMGHLACFGTDREGFVGNLDTGEPLGADEPLPEGYLWGDDSPAPPPPTAPAESGEVLTPEQAEALPAQAWGHPVADKVVEHVREWERLNTRKMPPRYLWEVVRDFSDISTGRPNAELADKYKWQVRDTCARAEEAEAANAELVEALKPLLDLHAKWFALTGSGVSQRWDRIPAEDRLTFVSALRALAALQPKKEG